MRLRSGRITGRRLPTYAELNRQYPLFDFPHPRRHRLRSRHPKSVSVRVHSRRMPLSRKWTA